MKKWIIIVVVVGLLGWAVYDFAINKETTQELDPDVGLEKGNLAPDFELETIDGETVKLSDFRGEKVMLNFWATWCPPCRAEMPDMQKFHEEHDEGVILAVNLTETENSPRNVVKFLEEYGISFTVLEDKNTTVGNIYRAQSLPTSYLINSEGKIHNIAVGPLNYELMVQEFEKMD
ncbi:TlpA family protein disulfide reductase [Pseudogracilibacillus sp. SO30301A]|uniref:TlpA family protein disulfide reductase n=1 Tax=Pseudogracilibacillus sp. SO30301A TaxID=3098291 RepID=UPI00300E6064